MFTDFIRQFPQYEEEAIERAGIMQYDGRLPKGIAERKTIELLMKKYINGREYKELRKKELV